MLALAGRGGQGRSVGWRCVGEGGKKRTHPRILHHTRKRQGAQKHERTCLGLERDLEAGTEEVQGQGEVVVVDEARVDGKGAHEEKHVAGGVQRLVLC